MIQEFSALSCLTQVADHILDDDLEFDRRDPTKLIVYLMFTKQRYHAKSILALLTAGQDWDALLIARSALEAWAQLKYALLDFPNRAQNWVGLGMAEELRFQLDLNKLKIPKRPEILAAINESLECYSKGIIKEKYIARLEDTARKQQVPPDKYEKDWHEFQYLEDLFSAAEMKDSHRHYDRASKWMHSTPRSISASLVTELRDHEVEKGCSDEFELAVLISANALLHSLDRLIETFGDGISEDNRAAAKQFKRPT